MKPLSLMGLWVTGLLLGGVLGAGTNLVNSQVSELYFRTILRWGEVVNITTAIVAQGIFEGLLCGLILSTILTAVIGIASKAQCPYGFGVRSFVLLVGTALTFWVLGGLLAMGLATLSPEFYQHAFIGVPAEPTARLRYAWVGGSIWGVQFGGVVATILCSVLFPAGWRQREKARPAAAS